MDWMIVLYIGIGYLLGSIPFALVIGKLFYHTDVREFGSGNLGGTNAGRVLGKKAGIATILLDIVKVILAVAIVSVGFDNQEMSIWAGVAAAFGHCYPIFAHFKGGKAAATLVGFLLSTAIFTFHSIWFIIVPLIAFFLLLYLFKMVSLASMGMALVSSIYITCMQNELIITAASWLLTVLVIYRHRANIIKIKNHKESKITWM
ncbi:glycerol-3-phosphate 1-O-acyltransferase [bacterium c-19]|nr:glycerol-3-phosphate 1-O-acyltransferase [bacterium c-19]